MSSYINSYVHKGLVVRETDKAALITMPRDMVGGTWFTWLPKSMLKDTKQDYLHYTYRKDWEFKLIQSENINIPVDKWKNIKKIKAKKFEDIFEEYDTTYLDSILLINNIESNIDILEKVISGLRFSLSTIQEIENLPSEINDLISETDLSDLDLLVENITLAKDRYINE